MFGDSPIADLIVKLLLYFHYAEAKCITKNLAQQHDRIGGGVCKTWGGIKNLPRTQRGKLVAIRVISEAPCGFVAKKPMIIHAPPNW